MIFEKILVTLTFVTGLFWLVNKFYKFNNKIIKEIIDYTASFFIIFILVLIIRSFLIEPYVIPTGSMRPTLLEGDFILVNKYKYGLKLPIIHKKILNLGTIKRGEVIIFWQESSKKILIKRVIGLPGDHIVYKEQKLYINNKLVQTENNGVEVDLVESNRLINNYQESLPDYDVKHNIYLDLEEIRVHPYDNIIVGKDSYFVMGDNRDQSLDSRYSGLVEEKDVLGKAFFTWFSFDWPNKVFRFARIFKKIK